MAGLLLWQSDLAGGVVVDAPSSRRAEVLGKQSSNQWKIEDSILAQEPGFGTFDPWSSYSRVNEDSLPIIIGIDDSHATQAPAPSSSHVFTDPWLSEVGDLVLLEETQPTPQGGDDGAIILPEFNRNLRSKPSPFVEIDRPRFDREVVRIRWVLALLGPLTRARSLELQEILSDLFSIEDQSQRLFRSLCDLAVELDEVEDFSNTLSFKLWWHSRSEYWLVRNRAPGSFYNSKSGFSAMSWPMCVRIAQHASDLCWDRLPIDDWVSEWQRCQSVLGAGWNFANWLHNKIVFDEPIEFERSDDLDLDHSFHPAVAGFPQTGCNIRSGAMDTSKWLEGEKDINRALNLAMIENLRPALIRRID